MTHSKRLIIAVICAFAGGPALATGAEVSAVERLARLRAARDASPAYKLREALAIAQAASREPATAGAAFRAAAYASADQENYRAAAGYEERARTLCEAARDWTCAAKASSNAGAYLTYLDDLSGSLRASEQAARLFIRAGDPAAATHARYNLAVARSTVGDYTRALADLDAANPYLRPSATGVFPGLWHAGRAQILVELGREREALVDAQRAVAFANGAEDKFNDATFRAEAWRTMAMVYAALKRRPAALASAREAMAQAHDIGGQELTQARFGVADALMSLGRASEALPLVEAALPGVEDFRRREKAEHLLVAARTYAAVGRPDGAVALMTRAYDALYESAKMAAIVQTADVQARVLVADREAEAARLVATNARRAAADARQLAWYRMVAVVAAALGVLLASAIWFRALVQQARRRADATLAERTRVAGEVHDTLMSGFAAVAQQVELAREYLGDRPSPASTLLGKAATVARSTLAEAREAVWDLRAPVDGASLPENLHAAADDAMTGSTAVFDLTVVGDPKRVSSSVASTLLRVAREAVTNAIRHGAADHLRAELTVDRRSAQLVITDNGRGFTVDPDVAADGGRWGLLGMRERMARLGGSLSITSNPGEGARVEMRAPLEAL